MNISPILISPCLNFSIVDAMLLGIFDIMLVNIISEIPLPIPFSFICSPSHIRNMVPDTRVIATVMCAKILKSFTILIFEMKPVIVIACILASTSVKYRVYVDIFFLPRLPSF